jgi:hypothetical protein
VQQVLDIAKRQWKTDVEHHRNPDDLRARFEVAEGDGLVIQAGQLGA